MPTFPRTLRPRNATIPKVPTGLVSQGHTGGVQLRTTQQAGRVWEETWPDLKAGRATVEALIATIEEGHHQWIIFDVVHQGLPGSGLAPGGVAGSGRLVMGGSQSGASLITDGWPVSTSGVVKHGDVFRVAGLNTLFRATADAASNGSGVATVSLNPPIPVGSSPADNAVLTLSGCVIRAFIRDYSVPEGRAGVWLRGLRVVFQEAP